VPQTGDQYCNADVVRHSKGISQADRKEKMHQVGQINLIYTCAKQVVVWLGKEDDDSTIVFRCCELLSKVIDISPEKPYASGSRASIKTCGYYKTRSWQIIAQAFYNAMLRDEKIQKVLKPRKKYAKSSATTSDMRSLFLESLDRDPVMVSAHLGPSRGSLSEAGWIRGSVRHCHS
jgi:hypothetical protein